MENLSKLALALLATTFTFSANADPIEVVALDGGAHPDTLGGYEMTPFVAPADGRHRCTPSPSGGRVCFDDGSGNRIALVANDPRWWRYDGSPSPDHGNIFVVTGRSLVDLILPRNTRAISLFTGANGNARAWIRAYDDQHNSTRRINFRIGPNRTQGYGIYTTGCSSLTRVSVDPVFRWGFGYLSSNQGECTTVPEPGTLGLLGLGLLGLVLTRRNTLRRQLT
jgi:hypothetical protein